MLKWVQRTKKEWRSIALLVLFVGGLATPGCIDRLSKGSNLSRVLEEENILAYQKALEERLLARYNNHPTYGGRVAAVRLRQARPPRRSVDGKEIQVEFTQLVYDRWGERIPDLEREYYVITFGHGVPRFVRTDPTITVGMHLEGGFSEAEVVDTGLLGTLRKEMPTPEDAKTPSLPTPRIPLAEPSLEDGVLTPSSLQNAAENHSHSDSIPTIPQAPPEVPVSRP